jgi:hypothetical protein
MRFAGARRTAENDVLPGDQRPVDTQNNIAFDEQFALDLGDTLIQQRRIERRQCVIDRLRRSLPGARLADLFEKGVEHADAGSIGGLWLQRIGERLPQPIVALPDQTGFGVPGQQRLVVGPGIRRMRQTVERRAQHRQVIRAIGQRHEQRQRHIAQRLHLDRPCKIPPTAVHPVFQRFDQAQMEQIAHQRLWIGAARQGEARAADSPASDDPPSVQVWRRPLRAAPPV